MHTGEINLMLLLLLTLSQLTRVIGFNVPTKTKGIEVPSSSLSSSSIPQQSLSHHGTQKVDYIDVEIDIDFDSSSPAVEENQTQIETDRRKFLASTASASFLLLGLSQPPPAHASATATSTQSTASALTFDEVISKASKRALSGGKAGASASIVQVLSLMWLRTSMNYQYRYGGTLNSSLDTLYKEGGIPRLYQGLPFALVQGPLTRFGDTAANVGILVILDSVAWSQGMPLPLKTLCGSIAAGTWRIFLMPVDTSKTVLQVEGKEGLDNLYDNVKQNGPGPLYRGALASAAATTVGHFPWFLTYNYLSEVLPLIERGGDEKDSMILLLTLVRAAFIGLAASCVSDCCSNSLRVIKTTKQTTNPDELNTDTIKSSGGGGEISYTDAVKIILEKDGWVGLFGRGLKTRLLTNAIQGAAFSVLWRYFQQVGN